MLEKHQGTFTFGSQLLDGNLARFESVVKNGRMFALSSLLIVCTVFILFFSFSEFTTP